jgi:predicted AAA+ superfamily ATPase
VYLSGARQCGKSTLVQNLQFQIPANYISFDQPPIRSYAKQDPNGFIAELPQDKLVIIDEVQKVPEIYDYLKISIDENRLQGKQDSLYLLTGSANIFALPELAGPLVGRMAILTLYPFSAAEAHKSKNNFIDQLWNEKLDSYGKFDKADIVSEIQHATFPELAKASQKDRTNWFANYVNTILQRDARELARIRKPDSIYQLLASFTSRVGSLLNNDNVMKETGLSINTYYSYKTFCHAAFITFEIESWSKPNKLDKRFVKSKKLYFTDTGLLCYLMRRNLSEMYQNDKITMGHLFENFIATEILKASSSSKNQFYISHFNPVNGKEVDFIIERQDGETIAIEVKLDATPGLNDFKNLTNCKELLGDKFKKGIVIYTGKDIIPFGDRLWAVPVNYLWS